MKITLGSLKLKYFKGIKKFELDLNGQNANVYGDNATGKTTLYDAFLWVLFDKDSLNRSDFGIKTLGPDGEALNGMDHSVEASLLVDGKPLVLKKVYYEKWTKKRGEAEKVFSGHTTDYYINDVPSKKKEYDAKIAELSDENIFRLLTDPRFFNEQKHWQDRRKLLLEVCGDISDADVIGSDKRLSKLSKVLEDRTIDDHKKVVAAKRKKINQELDRIPIRIDEVQNGTPDISELDFADIRKQIAELQEVQDIHRKTISRIEAGGEIAEKEKEIARLESDLLKMRSEYETRKWDVRKGTVEKLDTLKKQLREKQNDIYEKDDEAKRIRKHISDGEAEAQTLRDKFCKISEKEFELNQETVCPTCGQSIPEDQLEEAREKALKAFNLDKSKKLEKINADGKKRVSETADYKISYNDLQEDIEKLKAEANAISSSIKEEETKVKAAEDGLQDVKDTKEFKAKTAEMKAIRKDIESLRVGTKQQVDTEKESIKELQEEAEKLQADLSKEDQYQKATARIKELQEEQKRLSAELEALDEQLYLTEEFTKTKVNLLESSINSKFKMARFKLFDVQVNGDLRDCCETVYDGVPYSDLNNAARINIGLDIINTLSERYGFSAPIFVDNREAVTQLTDVDAQVISLVVSEQDKKLRVELEQNEVKEAV